MAVTSTAYKHIVLDEAGIPIVAGTALQVVEIVEAQQICNWSPEEYRLHHPSLTLGQIYSALAYYWDNQESLDRVIAERQKKGMRNEQAAAAAPLRGKAMAAALEKLAQIEAFSGIDPIVWQKDLRQDEPLLGRESC